MKYNKKHKIASIDNKCLPSTHRVHLKMFTMIKIICFSATDMAAVVTVFVLFEVHAIIINNVFLCASI